LGFTRDGRIGIGKLGSEMEIHAHSKIMGLICVLYYRSYCSYLILADEGCNLTKDVLFYSARKWKCT
jgi:hypothetical protein